MLDTTAIYHKVFYLIMMGQGIASILSCPESQVQQVESFMILSDDFCLQAEPSSSVMKPLYRIEKRTFELPYPAIVYKFQV